MSYQKTFAKAAAALGILSVMHDPLPFIPDGRRRIHNPFIDGIKDGPKGSIDDLLAKSQGKRSKRAKRRKGDSNEG